MTKQNGVPREEEIRKGMLHAGKTTAFTKEGRPEKRPP